MASAMTKMLRGLALCGLLMTWAADVQAERGDHDTPATERQSQGFQTPKARQCRGDEDWLCETARILPRGVIMDWLRDWDFDDLEDLRLRDDVYTLKAIDPYGRPVQLTIDAFSGRILHRDPR